MRSSLFVMLAWLVSYPNSVYSDAESVCYGTTRNGRLEGGVKLPASGANFVAYGSLPVLLGRTYVHSTVRTIVVEAYKDLEASFSQKIYKYAETGLRSGGEFKPHKTHRNGLSVDFMVPVIDQRGRSVHFPTSPLNKWGYSVEFDDQGRYNELRIDFLALGAHLVALDKSARKHGARLWRVIFDPKLQPFLLSAAHGDYIRRNIKLSARRSWVRHDEHYHVDFDVPCKPL